LLSEEGLQDKRRHLELGIFKAGFQWALGAWISPIGEKPVEMHDGSGLRSADDLNRRTSGVMVLAGQVLKGTAGIRNTDGVPVL
jgi:hypothetical protein